MSVTSIECTRCRVEFPLTEDHTEIVRRNFLDVPQPSKVEHLCAGCWRVYVEEFLGQVWKPRG